jgi:NAD(P)-dependent dehydrogenase (short-subunit alcohol dehydrogenase family)
MTQDAVAVVTGASGGIGAAIAARLVADGAKVCLTYLNRDDAARAVIERMAAPAGSVIAVRADVGRQDDVVDLFRAVDERLGRVTALVNNAGVIGEETGIDEVSEGALAALWATNVTGAFLCAREAVRRMAPRHGGRGGAIVNISSMAGLRGGSAGRVAYGASKGALNAFTMGLGRELASDGIRVNAVAPGYVDTDVHRTPERTRKLEAALKMVPQKRAGRTEEIAEAVAWLLSDKASFVTSTVLTVAGGA